MSLWVTLPKEWGGEGALWSQTRSFSSCLSAWMRGSSRGRCFPGIRHQRPRRRARTPAGPLARLLRGLCDSAAASEGSGPAMFPRPRGGLRPHQLPCRRLRKAKHDCVCVRSCVQGRGPNSDGSAHTPLPRRPNSGLRKAVRFPRHCCPRRRRGMGRKEAAAAVFLALRTKPLYPLLPLLATVPAPCPGSHSHILLPCRGHAVARSGSAAPDQVAPLQAPRWSCGPGWRAFQGCPRHRCAVVKGELGTGASRSGTYLGTQSHCRPEGQSHARGPGNPGRT